MTYWVKKCAGCGAINHPAEVLCQACKVMLPNGKVEADNPAPKPSKEALEAIRNGHTTVGHDDTPIQSDPEPASEPEPTTSPVTPIKIIMPARLEVVVTDFDISFLNLIWLTAKIILAAIPGMVIALLILALIIGLLFPGPLRL